jgi:hypothetical protein
MFSLGLTVPAGDPRQPMRDIFDFNVEGRRVQQVEPAAAEHALPGSWFLGDHDVRSMSDTSPS